MSDVALEGHGAVPGEDGPQPRGSAEELLRPLAPAAVKLWTATTFLRGVGLAAGTLVAELTLPTPVPTGAGAAAILLVAIAVSATLPRLRYRAWGFALRERDLYLRRGVLLRTTSIIPHARIQHVDTRHGPLQRGLGLASVIVYTAGTRGAIEEIPALDRGEAESLRDRLASLSGAGDAV